MSLALWLMLKLIVVLAAGTYNYNSHHGAFDMLQTARKRNRRYNMWFLSSFSAYDAYFCRSLVKTMMFL